MNLTVVIMAIALMAGLSWQSMGLCRRLKNQARVANANVAFWLTVLVAYGSAIAAH